MIASPNSMDLMTNLADIRTRLREAGATRRGCVRVYGVLGFGLPFGCLFSLFLLSSPDLRDHPATGKALVFFLMVLLVGPLAGFLWGHLLGFWLDRWRRKRELPDSAGR